ncbi:MAG: aldo/keto reductase [Armatimonadota bacterium]
METRRLGTSELEITTVGFGAWAIGGGWWGPVEDEESIGAIRRAYELGINWFDTAPAYGWGHSERLVAEALGEHRDEVIIATKCGLKPLPGGEVVRDSTRERVLAECEESLRNLERDYIDLYQVHWPDTDTPFEETMGALVELYESGKIRAVGVSNFSVEQMTECLKHGPLHSLQPPYNMLQRDADKAILPFCEQQSIGVVCYGPLARGLLTGKFKEEPAFPDDDVRRNDPMFKGEAFQRNQRMVAALTEVAARYDKTVGQLAIRWVIQQPGVTSAIVGAKRASQVEQNVGGMGWEISEEDLGEIEGILGAA